MRTPHALGGCAETARESRLRGPSKYANSAAHAAGREPTHRCCRACTIHNDLIFSSESDSAQEFSTTWDACCFDWVLILMFLSIIGTAPMPNYLLPECSRFRYIIHWANCLNI